MIYFNDPSAEKAVTGSGRRLWLRETGDYAVLVRSDASEPVQVEFILESHEERIEGKALRFALLAVVLLGLFTSASGQRAERFLVRFPFIAHFWTAVLWAAFITVGGIVSQKLCGFVHKAGIDLQLVAAIASLESVPLWKATELLSGYILTAYYVTKVLAKHPVHAGRPDRTWNLVVSGLSLLVLIDLGVPFAAEIGTPGGAGLLAFACCLPLVITVFVSLSRYTRSLRGSLASVDTRGAGWPFALLVFMSLTRPAVTYAILVLTLVDWFERRRRRDDTSRCTESWESLTVRHAEGGLLPLFGVCYLIMSLLPILALWKLPLLIENEDAFSNPSLMSLVVTIPLVTQLLIARSGTTNSLRACLGPLAFFACFFALPVFGYPILCDGGPSSFSSFLMGSPWFLACLLLVHFLSSLLLVSRTRLSDLKALGKHLHPSYGQRFYRSMQLDSLLVLVLFAGGFPFFSQAFRWHLVMESSLILNLLLMGSIMQLVPLLFWLCYDWLGWNQFAKGWYTKVELAGGNEALVAIVRQFPGVSNCPRWRDLSTDLDLRRGASWRWRQRSLFLCGLGVYAIIGGLWLALASAGGPSYPPIKVQWSVQVGTTADVVTTEFPLQHENALFVPAGEKLYVLDCKTGCELWSLTLPSATGLISIPRLVGDRLILNTRAHVVCVDVRAGKLVWHTNPTAVNPMLMGSEGEYVLLGTQKDGLRVCTLSDGVIWWELPSVQRLLIFRGAVVGTGSSNELVGLDLKERSFTWSQKKCASVLDGKEVLYCLDEGQITVIDPASGQRIRTYNGGGTRLWKVAEPGDVAAFVVEKGNPEAERRSGEILAFNCQDGRLLWSRRVTSYYPESVNLYVSGDAFLVQDGTALFRIEPTSGVTLWGPLDAPRLGSARYIDNKEIGRDEWCALMPFSESTVGNLLLFPLRTGIAAVDVESGTIAGTLEHSLLSGALGFNTWALDRSESALYLHMGGKVSKLDLRETQGRSRQELKR